MNRIFQSIFKAIHEGKWLSIEYRNKKNEKTCYWIAINRIHVRSRSLSVEGFHITEHTIAQLDMIYIDSILSAFVVEASYCRRNEKLIRDIEEHPEKYEPLFGKTVNLKILNYLIDCSRLDTQVYQCNYALIRHLDGECFSGKE